MHQTEKLQDFKMKRKKLKEKMKGDSNSQTPYKKKQSSQFHSSQHKRPRKKQSHIEEANSIYLHYNKELRASQEEHYKKRKRNRFKIKNVKEKKIPYFMETIEMKSQVTQLKLENKKLKIDYAKLRKMNEDNIHLLLSNSNFTLLDESEEEEEFKKLNTMVKLKIAINKTQWNIEKKNREIKRLKLVKRELSEREFLGTIKYCTEVSQKSRKTAFKSMKKYKGKAETKDMTEDDFYNYEYQNLILEEYEEMLKEIQSKIFGLFKQRDRQRKEVEMKKEHIRKQIGRQDAYEEKFQLLDERKEELDVLEKKRAKYDKQNYLEIENEKQKLDIELKEIGQRKKDLEQEFTQLQATLSKELEKVKKEKMRKIKELDVLQNKNKQEENSSFFEEEKESNKDGDQVENKVTELLSRVTQKNVALIGDYLKYSLIYRQMNSMDVFEELVKNDDEEDQTSISLIQIEMNLRRQPLYLRSKESARLVARYLVEDNFENQVWFDSEAKNKKIVIKSIWRNLLHNYELKGIQHYKNLHTELNEILHHSKRNFLIEIERNKEAQEKLTLKQFMDVLKNSGIEDLSKDQEEYILIQLCGWSTSLDELKHGELFKIFCEEGKNSYFKKITRGEKLFNLRTRNKNYTNNKIDSQNKETSYMETSKEKTMRKSLDDSKEKLYMNSKSSQRQNKEDGVNKAMVEGFMININKVGKFNDKNVEREVKKQHAQVSSVTEIIKNQKPIKKEETEHIDRRENEAQGFVINITPTQAFNDEKAKKKCLEDSKKITEYKDLEKKTVNKNVPPSIVINNVSKFNDAKMKQQIEENNKKISEIPKEPIKKETDKFNDDFDEYSKNDHGNSKENDKNKASNEYNDFSDFDDDF